MVQLLDPENRQLPVPLADCLLWAKYELSDATKALESLLRGCVVSLENECQCRFTTARQKEYLEFPAAGLPLRVDFHELKTVEELAYWGPDHVRYVLSSDKFFLSIGNGAIYSKSQAWPATRQGSAVELTYQSGFPGALTENVILCVKKYFAWKSQNRDMEGLPAFVYDLLKDVMRRRP